MLRNETTTTSPHPDQSGVNMGGRSVLYSLEPKSVLTGIVVGIILSILFAFSTLNTNWVLIRPIHGVLYGVSDNGDAGCVKAGEERHCSTIIPNTMPLPAEEQNVKAALVWLPIGDDGGRRETFAYITPDKDIPVRAPDLQTLLEQQAHQDLVWPQELVSVHLLAQQALPGGGAMLYTVEKDIRGETSRTTCYGLFNQDTEVYQIERQSCINELGAREGEPIALTVIGLGTINNQSTGYKYTAGVIVDPIVDTITVTTDDTTEPMIFTAQDGGFVAAASTEEGSEMIVEVRDKAGNMLRRWVK